MAPPNHDSDAASRDLQFAKMLENPPLLPDPVFPKLNYLAIFGRSFFEMLLRQWGKAELISQIADSGSSAQVVMLRVGWVAFWAIDFEEKSQTGITGRDEFLDRVKEPIRRPPANMAAFSMEQHLIARGMIKIQIAQGSSLPGEYEVCKLKTIGLNREQLWTLTEARVVVGNYRQEYNQVRPHSRLGYESPAVFAARSCPSPAPVGLRPPYAGDGQRANKNRVFTESCG